MHKLLLADVFDGLKSVEDGSVSLVVSSPPYNIGKEYEVNGWKNLDEYMDWMARVIELLCKKVDLTGSVCWQTGNYVEKGKIFPIDKFCYDFFDKQGFALRNRIIWRFNFGHHASSRLSGRYEMLSWFTKSDEYKFNLDRIRIPQLYPGKRHAKSRGDRAGQPSGNPLGKNPSDFWEFDASEHFLDQPIWELPNVKANHPEQTGHPCQFPIELAERCVLAFTEEGDVVLDPFVGTGTSAVAALKHKRRAIGIEKQANYLDIAEQRIRSLADGDLKQRPLGKIVRRPKPNEKVSRVPAEWERPAT